MQTAKSKMVNGIDTDALRRTVAGIAADPAKGAAEIRVRTAWTGGTTSETTIDGCAPGGEEVARSFRFTSNGPLELCGMKCAPDPQELLLGALSACMIVGWVAVAALRGVRLDALAIETDGRLDLRGFLGIDDSVAPGYESLRYRVCVRGDAPAAVFEEIHETVRRTSPNYFNLSRPIVLEGELVVG